MSMLPKNTATKVEMKMITKALKAGMPKEQVAKELNIKPECVLNFVSPALRARVKAQENIRKREYQKLQREEDALKKEAARLEREEQAKVEKEELKVLTSAKELSDLEKERLKELEAKYKGFN